VTVNADQQMSSQLEEQICRCQYNFLDTLIEGAMIPKEMKYGKRSLSSAHQLEYKQHITEKTKELALLVIVENVTTIDIVEAFAACLGPRCVVMAILHRRAPQQRVRPE
jgi:hypothetical protein